MPDSSRLDHARVGIDVSVLRQFNTGTEEFIEGLVGGLAGIGMSVVGLGADVPLDARQDRLGQPLRTRRSPIEKWSWERTGIVRAARTAGVDLLHIPYMTHPPARPGLPTIVNVHDVIPYRFSGYQRRFRDRRYFTALRSRLPLATCLVAVSQTTADDFARVFPRCSTPVVVIPNGVHESFFEPPTADGEAELARVLEGTDRPRLLYVGGYQMHKNVDILLRAAVATLDQLDAELVLVGGAGRPELEALAGSSLKGRLRLTGRLSRPALRALYASSTALLFPSRYEGFGLPPAQALAAGVPVAASLGPALQEVLGEAALFADPDDVSAWAHNVVRIVTEGELRRRLTATGQEQSQRFRWSAVAARYLDLYREVSAS